MAPDIHTFNARDFRSNPIYRHQAPFDSIQAELQKMARFYRGLERQYNYFTVALIICIAVPLVLLFMLPVLRELGWLLIFVFLIAGIYAGTMRQRARQWPFPRDRDRLFNDVLKLLKRDVAPQEPLEIQLCLGNLSQTGKAIQQRPDPNNPSQQLEDWRNPWFGIKGRFQDGSLFSLRLVERATKTIAATGNRAAAQASPSSQTSQKSIAKSQKSTRDGFDLNLQLHVDPRHYGDLTPLAPHLSGAVKLLPGAELIHHYSADQDLSLTLSLPPAFTASSMYQSTVMLFLSAYHILHLAALLNQPSLVSPTTELASGQNPAFIPHPSGQPQPYRQGEGQPNSHNPQSPRGLNP